MTQQQSPQEPRLQEIGEQSQLLYFEADIRTDINSRLLQTMAFLQQTLGPALRLSPAYHSLLIEWPGLPDTDTLLRLLSQFQSADNSVNATQQRHWRVPVCYGGEYGVDLSNLAQARNLSEHELIRYHSNSEYRVFMLGFAPGYAYLGPLDKRLHSPRRSQPRASTPAGSISIGGRQTLIAGVSMPSGWHLIGQTPLNSFRPELESPCLFAPGDTIRFNAIDADEFRHWQALDPDQQWQRLQETSNSSEHQDRQTSKARS